LHLLKWKKIIIEVDDKTRLKPNAVKTEAVLKLRADAVEYRYIDHSDIYEGGVGSGASDVYGKYSTTTSTTTSTNKGSMRHQSSGYGSGIDVRMLNIFRDVSEIYNIPSSF
jgi:hypothetical protein